MPLRRIEQTAKFLGTVNVGNYTGRLLRNERREWHPLNIASADCVAIKSEQHRVLSVPVTRECTIATEKCGYLLLTDFRDFRFLSDRTAKRCQQTL
jgi:hypothetical protein